MFYNEIRLLRSNIEKDSEFFDPASYGLKNKTAKAEILFKSEQGILSGIEIVENLLKDFGLKMEFYYSDAEELVRENKNIRIGVIEGNAYSLLICERTFLNVLSIMSSIAGKTYEYSKTLQKMGVKTKIAATRKTIPLWGNLQKLAVMHGGGDTHRWNLSETVMLKDNHLKLYGGIENAVTEVKKYVPFTKKIEVETETLEEALKAAGLGIDIIMLDNFTPENAKAAAKQIKNINEKILVEVSGGIRKSNFADYGDNNIDIISMGTITSELSYKDFSLEILEDNVL